MWNRWRIFAEVSKTVAVELEALQKREKNTIQMILCFEH